MATLSSGLTTLKSTPLWKQMELLTEAAVLLRELMRFDILLEPEAEVIRQRAETILTELGL